MNTALRNALKSLMLWLPDPAFYQYKYFLVHGRHCNFRQPRRFSEKIYHRMRYPTPLFSRLADKVAAREYIAEVVGERYLVPAYFSCSKVTPETFERLPDTFVMKANHSAGQTRIVLDKRKEDLDALARLANSWLKADFSVRTREKHYRYIPRQVIFERALLTNGQAPDDYKFNVFNPGNGAPPFVFIQYVRDRFTDMTQDLYLEDWTPTPFRFRRIKASGQLVPRVEALEDMLALAKRLAEPFGYLRVDCYYHEGRIYVGELTLTPGAGVYTFDPPEWDERLGDCFGWPERVPAPGRAADATAGTAPDGAPVAACESQA